MVLVAAAGWLAVSGGVSAGAADGDVRPAAAYLAEQLRRDPVYVSDQAPRVLPRSVRPALKKIMKRADHPVYVIAGSFGGDLDLLAAVHRELGRDGVYVQLGPDTMDDDAEAFGVAAPADDAMTAASAGIADDAGPLDVARRFTELLDDDPDDVAERAEEALTGDEPRSRKRDRDLHTSPEEREVQSVLSGVLVGFLPLLILLLPMARRRPAPRWYVPRPAPAIVAVVTGALLAGLVGLAFGDTRSRGEPAATAAELRARAERVAAGLRKAPLYEDEETRRLLTGAERAGLLRRLGRSDVPVYVAMVPMGYEDESEADPEYLAHLLHRELGKDGIYVVGDANGGTIMSGELRAINYGGKVASSPLQELPERIAQPEDDMKPQFGKRLGALLTRIDGLPRRTRPDTLPYPPDKPDDPQQVTALASVYAGPFPVSVAYGAGAAALVFGGVLVFSRGRRRRPADPLAEMIAGYVPPPPHYPSGVLGDPEPRAHVLRRLAGAEIDGLGREFEAAEPRGPLRTRVWDCLDAATLLVDRDADGRVDAGVAPADLAAAIVLAQAGRQALAANDPRDHGKHCRLNPLHGPAAGRERARIEAGGPLRTVPLCATCRGYAREHPEHAHTLALALPGRQYQDDVEAPLSAAHDGVSALIRRVREHAGVR